MLITPAYQRLKQTTNQRTGRNRDDDIGQIQVCIRLTTLHRPR
jgi:hypothetical protein